MKIFICIIVLLMIPVSLDAEDISRGHIIDSLLEKYAEDTLAATVCDTVAVWRVLPEHSELWSQILGADIQVEQASNTFRWYPAPDCVEPVDTNWSELLDSLIDNALVVDTSEYGLTDLLTGEYGVMYYQVDVNVKQTIEKIIKILRVMKRANGHLEERLYAE